MSKNFVPKSVFIIKNQDGSTSTVNEWDYGQLGNGGLEFIPVIILGMILSVIFTPLLLIISSIKTYLIPSFFNVIGVIFGVYFLIDSYNQWIFSSLFIFLSSSMIIFLIAINIASLFCHIMILSFGTYFMNNLKNEKNEKNEIPVNNIFGIGIGIIIIGLFIGLFLSSTIGDKHIKQSKKWEYESKNNIDNYENNYLDKP